MKPPEVSFVQATSAAALNYPERALHSGLSTQLMPLSFTTLLMYTSCGQLRAEQSAPSHVTPLCTTAFPVGQWSLIYTKDSAKFPALLLRQNLLASCGESTGTGFHHAVSGVGTSCIQKFHQDILVLKHSFCNF